MGGRGEGPGRCPGHRGALLPAPAAGMGPPLGQRGHGPSAVLPGHTQARRSPLLLLRLGGGPTAGMPTGVLGAAEGLRRSGRQPAGARTPGAAGQDMGPPGAEQNSQEGPDAGESPPPLAGSLGQGTGL